MALSLRAGEWAGLLIPLLVIGLLVVAGYVYFMLDRSKALRAAPNRANGTGLTSRRTPAPSLPPSVRAVPSMPRPSQRPSAPSSSVTRSSRNLFLCPELIVPDKVECTLNVPRLALVQSNSRLNVTDTKGGSVFRVDFSRVPERDGTRLVMRSPTGDVTFGTASDSRVTDRQGSSAQAALTIINPKDPSRQYLLQQKSGGDFQVSNSTGQFLRFLSVSGGYNAIDDQDQLLAFADPPQREADQVARCGPLVDAGLMVMCFLGIGVLLNDQSQSTSRCR
ncbi:unnamed protein product [Symbiodinium pilosum]|uniref:Uncharacterized protein n=1 Tax=Symbiodinium pilosum TaxID=2952 RepID=A0A812U5I9_SYMPI|nr:unnamed protein product [Symbiodinium pilosum]